MGAIVLRSFVSQVFTVGQKAAVEYCGHNYLVTFNSMLVQGVAEGVTSMRGVVTPETTFAFEARRSSRGRSGRCSTERSRRSATARR
jgi:vesicle-fusing ATPase